MVINYIGAFLLILIGIAIIILKKNLVKIVMGMSILDSGINLTPDFYLKFPGLDNTNIEVRKEIKKSIGNITEYKLQPFIIKLYTILTSFKGTDTLQKRKYKKMIEHQEAAILYNQEKGN